MFDIDIVRLTQSPFKRGHGSLGLVWKNFSSVFKGSILAIIVPLEALYVMMRNRRSF